MLKRKSSNQDTNQFSIKSSTRKELIDHIGNINIFLIKDSKNFENELKLLKDKNNALIEFLKNILTKKMKSNEEFLIESKCLISKKNLKLVLYTLDQNQNLEYFKISKESREELIKSNENLTSLLIHLAADLEDSEEESNENDTQNLSASLLTDLKKQLIEIKNDLKTDNQDLKSQMIEMKTEFKNDLNKLNVDFISLDQKLIEVKNDLKKSSSEFEKGRNNLRKNSNNNLDKNINELKQEIISIKKGLDKVTELVNEKNGFILNYKLENIKKLFKTEQIGQSHDYIVDGLKFYLGWGSSFKRNYNKEVTKKFLCLDLGYNSDKQVTCEFSLRIIGGEEGEIYYGATVKNFSFSSTNRLPIGIPDFIDYDFLVDQDSCLITDDSIQIQCVLKILEHKS